MRHSKTYKSHQFVIFKWKTQQASTFGRYFLNSEKSKIHSFFHAEPKNKEKYTCTLKRGKLFFWEKKNHIWLFFLSRNLLIIRLLYIITFIWRLVPSCCWQEGGGDSCVNFPRSCKLPICLIIFPSTDSFPLEYQ